MAKYQTNEFIGGKWVKGAEVQSGTKCKLVSEVKPQASQFQDKDGNAKTQDVGKILFQGFKEPLNISLNRATVNALVNAFGEDSTKWINKTLIAETEKTKVAGRNVFPVYLIPEGYKKIDDENGYTIIVKEEDDKVVQIGAEDEGIAPEDLPF